MTMLRTALLTCSELLPLLREKETRLHARATQCNPACLADLLHPDFEGCSSRGHWYSRDAVLQRLPQRERPAQLSQFHVSFLGPGLAQLIYLSLDSGEDRSPVQIQRCSLWQFSKEGWRLRYHQATPTATLAVPERMAA